MCKIYIRVKIEKYLQFISGNLNCAYIKITNEVTFLAPKMLMAIIWHLDLHLRRKEHTRYRQFPENVFKTRLFRKSIEFC